MRRAALVGSAAMACLGAATCVAAGLGGSARPGPDRPPAGARSSPAPAPASASTTGGGFGSPHGLARVEPADLTVTHGSVGSAGAGALRIEHPEVRGIVLGSNPDRAELRVTYRGPSASSAPLASGELRRQVGLKLRAENGCNLVYVMWRIEPRQELVVSVKENPGMDNHGQCGARGYRFPRPEQHAAVPPLPPGQPRLLAASLQGDVLTVRVDGALCWRGPLGGSVASLRGPVGLRTDNGQFDIELFAQPGGQPPPRVIADE